jgi:tetratricopeptide (TPR) repeat protein
MSPGDSKLYYKIALTYINEQQWQSAIKQLENALRINRNSPEYHLALGQCALQLKNYKDATQYFSLVVRNRPKNVRGWEALIKCLLESKHYDEAIQQCISALKNTEGKSIFHFLYSTVLFAANKPKEALVQLETGLKQSPQYLKKFFELNPSILQNQQVVDMIARYKKPKRKK